MADAFTHLDGEGRARMVDVSSKPATERSATAHGRVRCDPTVVRLLLEGRVPKGDVSGVARLAGIMGAKRTADLIPLCHPLALTDVDVRIAPDPDLPGLQLTATARCVGPTGVEMEALTAVAVAALTVVDMIKAADRWAVIEGIGLVEKNGGRSGSLSRPGNRPLK